MLDLKMPKVDGLEVLQKMKNDPVLEGRARGHHDVVPRRAGFA